MVKAFRGTLTPSRGIRSVGGGTLELADELAGELSRARFPDVRSLKLRKGDFGKGCFLGFPSVAETGAVLVLLKLSFVSVLVRSTWVSIVGGLGLRRSLGILSIASVSGQRPV